MDQKALFRRACCVAAMRRQERAPFEDVKALADAALSSGIYTDAIREVAVDATAASDNAKELEARMFRDLGVGDLSWPELSCALVHEAIEKMQAGSMSPPELAMEIDAIVDIYLRPDYTGSSIGVETLVALAYHCMSEYDESSSEWEAARRCAPYYREIRAEALKWQACHKDVGPLPKE